LEKEILALFKFSRGTYYSWKKEKRPIIEFIEKYFKETELKEFIESGRIVSLESKHVSNVLFSAIKNYLEYFRNIYSFTKKEIEFGKSIEETSLYIYFDFINYIRNVNGDDIFWLHDDTSSLEIVLKELHFRYLNENPNKHDPFILHYLSNFNEVVASFILEYIRQSSIQFNYYGCMFDYKVTYIHFISEQFYKNEISREELLNLYNEKNEMKIKKYMRVNFNAPLLA